MPQSSDDNPKKPPPDASSSASSIFVHRMGENQTITIGDIKIDVGKIKNGRAFISIHAPRSIKILIVKKPPSIPQ